LCTRLGKLIALAALTTAEVGLAFHQPRKSVGAPIFAPDAMVNEKQAIGVIFCINSAKPWIIPSPKGVLPGGIKVVALRNIGPSAGSDLAQFRDRQVNLVGIPASRYEVRHKSRQTWVGGQTTIHDNGEGERIKRGRVRGRVFCRCEWFRRGPGKSFVELNLHSLVSATLKKSIA